MRPEQSKAEDGGKREDDYREYKGVYQVRAAKGHTEPATTIPPERIVRRLGFTCAADHSGHADKRPGRHQLADCPGV